MLRIGLDIGSTTAKLVVIDELGNVCFTRYKRHNAQMNEVVLLFLTQLYEQVGNQEVSLRITGSVGMGFTERYQLPFVQEVVAATKATQQCFSAVNTLIDIGGEDAKIVCFKEGKAEDLRMNGNCAGGTGAFIDQMAIILGVSVSEMNQLALNATQIYPIASRCGVFCKTDIQNLIAKNAGLENIAASIFHAVAVQTVTTLAHGYEIKTPLLFCGGPLTFIPALRKAFKNYLSLTDADIILPPNGELLPAYGTALVDCCNQKVEKLADLMARLKEQPQQQTTQDGALKPIFTNAQEYESWRSRMAKNVLESAEITSGTHRVFLGIDSGSTTTKIVVINQAGKLLYTFYKNNGGKPVETVAQGLEALQAICTQKGAQLQVAGSCSTGYGEDLIKAAFNLHAGMVETMAHYKAAHHLDSKVSFILDIGGQDMKAIFVTNVVIDRIEINEACSSGCGSFIETFAKSLGYTPSQFAQQACQSRMPANLGTRCTVFMNSKVKQVLREGATAADISAGLAYSVIKNCLYKVLKLKDASVLGQHMVVQGGTMRNDAVVRALELLTGAEVSRCNYPELMGAYGCALYAKEHAGVEMALQDMLLQANHTIRKLHCKGCENHCEVQQYTFAHGKVYYAGNRCERYFNHGLTANGVGQNVYDIKHTLLFSRQANIANPRLNIGIPRVLNMFEEYPFWHTLLTACGIQVCLSDPSDYARYEQTARLVMADNLCFPAKLVHSHIDNLQTKPIDRIFMPFVIHEQGHKADQNSYNCPIVTAYSAVIKSVGQTAIPIDSPVISFKDSNLLLKQCKTYLRSLGIADAVIHSAFVKAVAEQKAYSEQIAEQNRQVLAQAQQKGQLSILLAGRPYHADCLIQHNVSVLLAQMGINVLTDDIVRNQELSIHDTHFLSQWAYPNQIMRAAKWCAAQGNHVQWVQMTSFGCGPDAFLVDQVRDLLMRYHKVYTLLKLDDINNVGSMKLRVRSLVESLQMATQDSAPCAVKAFVTTPIYDAAYRQRKIIIPFFTAFISPLIPAVMRVAGYEVEGLPMSNEQSSDWGLKYANNEVCYPATLIVGDIIKAFKEHKYNPDRVVVGITQTGGQCRASNYLPLIKKALVDAGYTNTPVMALTLGSDLGNNQPALTINWPKVLPVALRAILYSDALNKFYHAAIGREKEKGKAHTLLQSYLKQGAALIESGRSNGLYSVLTEAAHAFDSLCTDKCLPKVGIVGEIYLKFNAFAHRNIVDWLAEQQVEVVPPVLLDFFTQSFVNRKAKVEQHIAHGSLTDFLVQGGYYWVKKEVQKVNRIGAQFRYFTPFGDIFASAKLARQVITLNAQFGEGWLLPAEIMAYAQHGVNNVLSLQPFGCIANHIVSKGIEKKIRTLYPTINLLSLDFDSGVSDVNIKNRLLLFIDKLKENTHGK